MPAFMNWKRSDTHADRKGLRCSGDRSMQPFQMNTFLSSRFEGDDIIEADLDISATHTGAEFMGIPAATGRKIRFDVHARGRFVDGKMAERWDRADFEDIKRQLTRPHSVDVKATHTGPVGDQHYAEPWFATGIH